MKIIQHKFVEFIPNSPEQDILYISIQYRTAVHLCICGCGNKVVTPISPTDWQMTFNGKAVTLDPSIGNWSFDCQSHYWIKNNKIKFARRWTEKEIRLGRENDLRRKKNYFEKTNTSKEHQVDISKPKRGFWQRVLKFLVCL